MIQLPYFYEPHITSSATAFTLSEATGRHCIQVLRMQVGTLLQLTDGRGNLFTAAITRADKKHCEVKVQDSKFEPQGSRKVCLAVSLLKNAARFEWFAEKATEMGVQEIVPLLCGRTERQHFRYERMQGIVVSAMLQSRQCWLPLLHEPATLPHTVANSDYTLKLVAHCASDENKMSINTITLNKNVQMLIGPEGDFTESEIALALQQGYKPVSLGTTRLRTETAAVMASALLIYSQ